MRRIDADKLGEVKFHSLPYTHITPFDVEAESYKRGWNDAIDAIIDNAPTIEPERKKGKWIPQDFNTYSGKTSTTVYFFPKCSVCGNSADYTNFCPDCGADMRGDNHDQSK